MQCSGRVTQIWGQRRPALVSFSFYSVRLEACLASSVSTGLVNAGTPSAPDGMRSALRALCYCCLGQFLFWSLLLLQLMTNVTWWQVGSISGGLILVLVLRDVSRCCWTWTVEPVTRESIVNSFPAFHSTFWTSMERQALFATDPQNTVVLWSLFSLLYVEGILTTQNSCWKETEKISFVRHAEEVTLDPRQASMTRSFCAKLLRVMSQKSDREV